MSVARQKASAHADPINHLGYGWWASAFETLSPLGRNNAAWSRMAHEAGAASEAASSHWRTLAELQMNAVGQAFDASLNFAVSQAERRREAMAQMIETLWPALAAAQPTEEAARV